MMLLMCRCFEADGIEDRFAVVHTEVHTEGKTGQQPLREVVATSLMSQLSEAERAAEAAWTRLQAEYELQKAVWESVELDMGRGPQSEVALMRHQGAVAGIQSKLDFAMSVREVDPDYAAQALGALLDIAEGSILLSHSMVASVRATARAETIVCARKMLVERLTAEYAGSMYKDMVGVSPCGLPTSDEAILEACELHDQTELAVVRAALLT